MRLVSATVHALRIPFVESFRHALGDRSACDSMVVRVRDELGTEGFGEGVPRAYVTGETPSSVIAELRDRLWPAVAGRELPLDVDGLDDATPDAPHAARAALSLAMLDCALRRQQRSIAELLPPRRQRVAYSGVITAGPLETAVAHAKRLRLVGLRAVKVKVGFPDDVARVLAVREILGPEVSLRLDANGAWTVEQAARTLEALRPARIASVEQPLRRGPVEELVRLKRATDVPLMADESLLSRADAEALIAARAVDLFNIRVSKCGGLRRSLELAELALGAGLGVQVGSQVGETAILSAAGRALAASLPEVTFVEGSFGTLLLSEDLSREPIHFGHRGEAPLLKGPGLGISIDPERLARLSTTTEVL